uniref:Uncharacterized protein n=1 Tax=Strombidium inclinatum TaxID=197538 RepID=A0A7S3IIG3_9SPIT|mmetsp:Transcript_1934/g.2785  ORF Transcript_1934/g.2785 Transcript_1934/m.2785 type:complete len:430 (+) Transcript_1934:1422-2711(+)
MGIDEEDIVQYTQDFRLFNSSDYMGKSKGLAFHYNKNMMITLSKVIASENGEEQLEELTTFVLDDIKTQYDHEVSVVEKEAAKAKKKADKKKNSTEEAEPAAEEEEETKKKNPVPKVRLSIEFSRSGYFQITKATVGTKKDGHQSTLSAKPVRKDMQLNQEQVRKAKNRLKWYRERDDNKIKADVAMNDFESMIYKLREWLREEENFPYVSETIREQRIEELTEQEDWLYDDGANQPHTVYEKKYGELNKELTKYKKRQEEDEKRGEFLEKLNKKVSTMKSRSGEWAQDKPWVSQNETDDVTAKITDFEQWLGDLVEKQEKLGKDEDPVLKTNEVLVKMKAVKKFFDKVNGKKAPPPPKPPKNETKEEEPKAEEGEAKPEDAKPEDAQKEDAKQEDAKQEESEQEEAQQEKSEEAKSEEPKSGAEDGDL